MPSKILMRISLLLFSWIFFFGCKSPVQTDQTPTEHIVLHPGQGQDRVAENIILLIGDGMGLSQITAGMYLNENQTIFEKFPIVGLHKSYSGDNLVTDSAAGATAFASGVKTYNGAVGVDMEGKPVKTILEEVEARGMKTGLVTSSSIVHATPAAFIAHVKNRKDYETIAADFLKTEVDFFVGGGKAYFERRSDGRNLYRELEKKGYFVSDYFKEPLAEIEMPRSRKFAYFTADKEPLPVAQGRDYLREASSRAMNYLNRVSRDEGFFLMIEGAQIDWGGHANDPEYVLSELREFESVISDALDFAREKGNTLVIVTADHETGGFAINPESTKQELNINFTTEGHTATMIPVFAYGPGSPLFSGLYENTAIYSKMKQLLGLYVN